MCRYIYALFAFERLSTVEKNISGEYRALSLSDGSKKKGDKALSHCARYKVGYMYGDGNFAAVRVLRWN